MAIGWLPGILPGRTCPASCRLSGRQLDVGGRDPAPCFAGLLRPRVPRTVLVCRARFHMAPTLLVAIPFTVLVSFTSTSCCGAGRRRPCPRRRRVRRGDSARPMVTVLIAGRCHRDVRGFSALHHP